MAKTIANQFEVGDKVIVTSKADGSYLGNGKLGQSYSEEKILVGCKVYENSLVNLKANK